jgi:hypothetical protein
MPSEVGSIPTHSRHPVLHERCIPASPWVERVPLQRQIVVIWVIAALMAATGGATGPAQSRAQAAETDTTAAPPDTTAAPGDSIRTITVTDSLGIPGTLKGQSDYDPVKMKEILGRMGSSEVAGRTTWERKKNPRTAMICSMLLPGLGQTYNGRRLKVGLMVGFTSYYAGNMVLNWHRYEAYAVERDQYPPGTLNYHQADQLAAFYKEEARTYLWWTGAVWLIGILDSWIDAHLYDVREYTPPPPPKADVPRTEDSMSYLTVGFGLSLK